MEGESEKSEKANQYYTSVIGKYYFRNTFVFWISGRCGHPRGKIFRFVRPAAPGNF